jgi:hypothetical protein
LGTVAVIGDASAALLKKSKQQQSPFRNQSSSMTLPI